MPPTTMATKVAMITSLPMVGDSLSIPAASTPAKPGQRDADREIDGAQQRAPPDFS